jgi:predicted ArsR family transcriptional regulator
MVKSVREKKRSAGDDSPAGQILFLLKRSERGMTVDDLCRALGVTAMAVHRQLKVLKGQGLVDSEAERQGRGRPLHLYRLTEAADHLFPNNYSELLIELLDELRLKEGPGGLKKLLQSQFKRFVSSHRTQTRKKDLPGSVDTVNGILKDNGYMSEAERISAKRYLIKLYNCPVSRVAKEFPYICSCEQCSLTELLKGAKVTRDHHILSGQNYCSYVVEKKE